MSRKVKCFGFLVFLWLVPAGGTHDIGILKIQAMTQPLSFVIKNTHAHDKDDLNSQPHCWPETIFLIHTTVSHRLKCVIV